MDKKELLKGLSEEQIAKAKSCHSSEELFALAKEEGVELNAEQLTFVTGGGCGEGGPENYKEDEGKNPT
ncbi:MAG: hypothetical protein K6F32_06475, partial [Bacilli bacterium]|nr:hypothetical protein [Bacilli bacterium]